MTADIIELKKVAQEHPRFRERMLPAEVEQTVEARRPDAVREYYEAIGAAIELEKMDALRHGFEPPIWKKADEHLADFRKRHPVGVIVFMILGGERSSKTEWKSKRLVENMLSKPNYIAWACHTTQTSSRDAQQRKIYKYIPPEFRPDSGRFRSGKIAKVNYTPWGGFTTDGFALPDPVGGASECGFKFYGMDPRSLEGSEIDEGWMDEEAPIEWLNVLIGRAVTRNGIIYLTFVAKRGFTPLVSAVLENAQTIEESEAELLVLYGADGKPIGRGKVPRVQENEQIIINSTNEDGASNRLKAKGLMMYFHTADNPYGNYESMKLTLDGASPERIKWQAYGVPTRTIRAQFNFVEDVHRIPHKRYVDLVAKLSNKGPLSAPGPRYLLVDPCQGRNWFMLALWFWAPKKAIIYWEWPSFGGAWAYIEGIGIPGPWAVPGTRTIGGRPASDGVKGEAQDPFHFGLDRYKEVIDKAEQLHGKFFAKYIDCRYAHSPREEREAPTTLIQKASEIDLEFVAMTGEKKILSGEADGSIELINTALSYDEKLPIGEFSPVLGRINEPNLMITDQCPNTIYALKTWTGKDGGHGACKDPIDCIRGAYLSELDYVDEQTLMPQTPWMGQFQGK